MRSSLRRTRRTGPAAAALVTTLLLAGCSSGWEGAGGEPAAAPVQDVLLQPLGAHGPDPFTASTVRNTAAPAAPDRGPDDGAPRAREVTGSTPGLYGGTRAVGSCDVERQVALLAADRTKARAFAEAAGIPEANVAGWLRGLTPVALRADTRVTDHRYREGRADAFQAVLQTGTSVLVDQYGSPRVRCACGNPLRSPGADPGGIHQGEPWDGFDPDRVIVVRPTTSVVTSLVIVNTTDSTWIERKTGSDGDEDRKPAVEPACAPDTCALTGSGTPDPTAPGRDGSQDPASPAPVPPGSTAPVPDAPDPSGTGGTGTEPPTPDPYTEPYPDPYEDPRTEPFPDPFAEPSGPPTAPDGDMPDELFPAGPVPDQPETFQG
ncbi:DUF6777 domain-containing protein [Streptomyces tanashiensis]|uniref:DUF6777 domain-containing protein n=1 Tax=Streptomyces tanashiensis TaxID=67367 RepID=A0ABY6QV48_9ACTN|nr:DUF6777 domain-containing protein [Streptomyces tanashiensis]UZX20369.1 hypothetical protein LDH80_06430 [Streptomyces tanashiensis]GGY55436.1 hypothetical protein GCM10010299_72240 [Streptomyces tanashiensis]